jgi:aminoglycoside 3'-phosphotransferase-2
MYKCQRPEKLDVEACWALSLVPCDLATHPPMPLDPLHVLPATWRIALAAHELVPVTAGMSGAHVFRIRDRQAGDRYLKIATGPDAAALRGEVERTDWLAAIGMRVPDVLMRHDSGDAFAIIMSALDGEPAEHISREHWRPVVTAIARAFATLHALPANACPFDESVQVRMARAHALLRQGAIDGSDFDARNIGVSPEALYARLAANPPAHEESVVVHGDATLSNLIFGEDHTIGFVDCGNAGRADRYVDLALLAQEIADRFGDEAREALLEIYGAGAWDQPKAEFYRDLYELF